MHSVDFLKQLYEERCSLALRRKNTEAYMCADIFDDLSRHPNPMALLVDIIMSVKSGDARDLRHHCAAADEAIDALGRALPGRMIEAIKTVMRLGGHERILHTMRGPSYDCAFKIQTMANRREHQEIGEAEDFFVIMSAVFARGYKCSCSDDIYRSLVYGSVSGFTLRELYYAFINAHDDENQPLLATCTSCDHNGACKHHLLALIHSVRHNIRVDATKRREPYHDNDRLNIYRIKNLNINRNSI